MQKKKIIINQYEQVIFGVIIILNMDVMMIEIKHCQLKNILIKLDHILKASQIILKNMTRGKFN